MHQTADPNSLCYHITISQKHFIPALYLIQTIRLLSNRKIIVVGNLRNWAVNIVKDFGVQYIDENDINIKDRFPPEKFFFLKLKPKYRSMGWYKQQFYRLSADRYVDEDFIIILDAEVFLFDNWKEENLFYEGKPKIFYWIASKRKSNSDYNMYRGSALLLKDLPECNGIMQYASSNVVKRYISGMNLFARKNLEHMWVRMNYRKTLKRKLIQLFYFSRLCFSEYQLYGYAVEYGLFKNRIPTVLWPDLLGWYDNHDDPVFHEFKKDATWSMCQSYKSIHTSKDYFSFIKKTADFLGRTLPAGFRFLDIQIKE